MLTFFVIFAHLSCYFSLLFEIFKPTPWVAWFQTVWFLTVKYCVQENMFRKPLPIKCVVGCSSTAVTTRHNLSMKFEAITILPDEHDFLTECHVRR